MLSKQASIWLVYILITYMALACENHMPVDLNDQGLSGGEIGSRYSGFPVASFLPSQCGDGLCDATEDSISCSLDCTDCGDGQCDASETHDTCPVDCFNDQGDQFAGVEEVTEITDITANNDTCGDHICRGDENAEQCSEDCNEESPLSTQPMPDSQGEIIGWVDNVSQREGRWIVSGWACHIGWAPSVEIAIYAGGSEGEGRFIKRALADAEEEAEVGQVCEIAGGQHRFNIPFTDEELIEFSGELIHVHGISPNGGDNRALNQSGMFSLPGHRTGGGSFQESDRDAQPVDLGQISWLHTDVSDWAVTSELTVQFQGGIICLDYAQARTWPTSTIPHNSGDYDIEVVANPWVILNYGGTWYAATWEWLVPGTSCKNMTSVAGDHIKQFAYVPEDWRPSSGERLYFMVSGLARSSSVTNVQERTTIVEVIWP